MSVGAAVIWRHATDWGQRVCFQDDSFIWLVNWCWLLEGGLSFFTNVGIRRGYNIAAGFLQSKESQRQTKMENSMFYILVPEVTLVLLLCSVRHTSLQYPVEETPKHGHAYRENHWQVSWRWQNLEWNLHLFSAKLYSGPTWDIASLIKNSPQSVHDI